MVAALPDVSQSDGGSSFLRQLDGPSVTAGQGEGQRPKTNARERYSRDSVAPVSPPMRLPVSRTDPPPLQGRQEIIAKHRCRAMLSGQGFH
jgi:hypothetical protein